MVWRRDDRSHGGRAGPGTPAHFIDPADQLIAGSPASALEPESGCDHQCEASRSSFDNGVTIRSVEHGTRVEVRSRFDQRWARGFEIEETVLDGTSTQHRVRRRSDNSVLPALFVDDDVREEKRKSMWWM